MKQTNNNNYWAGFGLGLLGGAGIMYLVGTKKGRELLRQFLDNTEGIEHSVEDIIRYINEFMPMNQGSEDNDNPESPNTAPKKALSEVMSKIKGIKLPKKQ